MSQVVQEIHEKRLFIRIDINVFKQCGSYILEISPINGWKLNKGVGKSKSLSFRYPLDSQTNLISVNIQFISQNSIFLHLIQSQNNNHCETMGIIVEIINENNPSDCSIKTFSNNQCQQLINAINKMCPQNVITDNKSSSIKTIFSGINQYSMRYKYKISQIADVINIYSSGNIEDNTITDCFTDCYNQYSIYSGIRSADKDGNICKEWKYSTYSYYKNTKSNICSLEGAKSPWCPTDNNYGYCDIPKCLSINKATGCVEINKQEILSDSLTINWSALKYQDEIIGYVTLLHNIDYICQQYHIQLCHNCQSENQLKNRIKNIYLSCKSGHVDQTINYETKFKELHQNHKYFIYIIPIIDINNIGEVRNITIHTKLAKPAVPQNIYSNHQSLNAIELSWDKQNDFTKYGPSNQYQIVIRNSNSNQINSKRSNQERIEFPNLEMCTSYCFTLRSENDAGESEWSKEQCYYTLAPKAGNVEIENIESGYFTSRTLRWKYLGGDICERKYRLEYQVKHTNETNYLYTNQTFETINNLKRNVIYTIQIRAENKMKTENGEINGQYSNKKQFFTGPVFVNISNYNDIIISKSDNKLMNISWNIIDDVKGSLFEFIIVVKNSSNMCNYVIDMQCGNCESPWNLNSLSIEERNSRNKLLKCDKMRYQMFNREDLYFNYLLESEIKFNNYSVEIFGINLLGVHQLNRKITIVPINSSVNKIAIIVILLVIFVLIGILFIVFREKRETFNKGKENENKSSLTTNKKIGSLNKEEFSIPIGQFCNKYQNYKLNAFKQISKEYSILISESKSIKENIKNKTINKNDEYFKEIVLIDKYRVKLKSVKMDRDILNASYIPFVNDDTKMEYIVALNPILDNLYDFWEMIWNENINFIILLTKMTSSGIFDCIQYWPSKVGQSNHYGNNNEYTVSLEEEIDQDCYYERTFTMIKIKDYRKVKQLHIYKSIDFSTSNFEDIDKFMYRFHEVTNDTMTTPYLIHSRKQENEIAAILCVDRVIKELIDGMKTVNILDNCCKLVMCRNCLIPKQNQYKMIYDFMNYFVNKYSDCTYSNGIYFNSENL